MDERHWWIATKIQESFHIGGFDNPTLLEDFLCEPRTLELINQFLNPNGPAKIFCCCDKPQQGTLSTRDLFITTSLANLKVSVENTLILYFLRLKTNKEVDPVRMERDIFCGELKQSAAENLTLLLSHVFLPVLRAQKDWGQCSDDQASQCVHNLEKYLGVLSEYGASTSATQQLLKKPEILVSSDFKQYRAAAFDETIVGEYETLVSDWIMTIDSILADGSAEERLMDMNAGPLTELERWRRRQRTLNNITEQLKSKDCKNVIGILITAKSKLLKKWKTIDACITDAANETKDKVKYLESVRKHLEQLYHDSTPVMVLNTALPGLTTSVRQMDSISRFYARSGYLGLLFSKVTNQLVQVCKDYIRAEAQPHEQDDLLWEKVHTEVETGPGRSASPHGGAKKKKGAKDQGLVVPDDEKLCERLNVCLTLYSHYKDSLRSIRDGLGGTHALSHFPSMSSLHSHRSHSQVGRRSIGGPSRSRMSTLQPSVSSKKAPSVTSSSDEGPHGIAFTDEDTILQHLDTFCQRLRQFLEVIDTLKQFHSLKEKCRGLPRPRREDLIGEDEDDRDSNADAISVAKPPPDSIGPPENPPSPMKTLMVPSAHGMMPVLEEEEPMSMPGSRMALNHVDSPGHGHEASEAMSFNAADEIHELNTQSRAVSKQAAHHLARLYARHEGEEDGPSISHIIQMYLEQMTDNFAQVVNTGVLLDVEGKDKDRFEEAHQQFQETAQLLDSMMCAYLQATFQRKMKTNECINILQRFVPVGARQGIRATIAEKYVETFQQYEGDLENVQQKYEREKDEPPIPRNAPPVAGSIFWCRKLLTTIEDPMKVFRDTKAITHLKDFQRVVKLYNRIATTLVTFETLWLQQWKAYIDGARNGLKAMLLVHHLQTGEIVVNADERILQLIQESRWMVRLGIPMPESVQDIVAQEHRFKSYKMHLEQCLQEYRDVCGKIPAPMKQLFLVHTEATLHYFQPGLTTLTWNSMNIDAFLHTVHSAIARLDSIVQHVINIIDEKVQGTVDIVSSMVLFDMELAFSKAWPPGEFGEAMLQSVEEKGQELLEFVNEVESAIFEIVSFLMSNKVGSPSQSPVASRVSTAPSHHPRRGSKAPSQRDTPMTLQTLSEVTEDLVVNELLEHYCGKVYDAVLSATSRSLAALAEASGCEGDCLKQTLARGSPRSAASRASTGVSSRSGLSMSWTSPEAEEVTFLRFEVVVKFNIPNTVIEPPLAVAQDAVNQVASAIMDISNGVNWWTSEGSETFHASISEEPYLNDLMQQLFSVIENLQKVVDRHIFHFKLYDFLWKDDMHTQFYEFISADPGTRAIKREVERLLDIEQKVLDIPLVLPVGPICLLTSPIRDALHGFSIAWKTKYAQVLHEDAKKMLDTAILYRSNVLNRLSLDVRTLDQLNSALNLLQELQDMENKIDDIYLPIETMYDNLREYKLRLPRNEVQEVEQLREKWQELIELSEQVRYKLLKEQRGAFEQELDKQVKNFVVEVIQFRNSFDAQGPAVPGVRPEEAVMRLRDFQERFALYDAKRRTLDSVSRLFGIVPKPFPELDKTGEELDLLGLLYGLFQKFIAFDNIFRERLWAEVDLEQANKEVEEYWEECLALPDKLKDWEAYQEMKNSIKIYLDVFPLLHRLATKGQYKDTLVPEIRNRHWLQVMSVTGSSFPLEAQAFKLFHLLDIGLIQHHDEIHEICKAASIELELEIKMRTIEEEWTEQVLTFESYKKRGAIYLAKDESERLLEQLEDAQALLATMLTSKHIGPLREEAASWAEKLKGVSEVLETWLEVQDLWQYLEAVFSNSAAAKELPQEAKRFIRIDKSWIKLMRKTYDTRNVLQCCYGGEIPKGVVLRHFREDLEVCFKSLTSYLDNKRKAFPRFFFLSDPVLLSMLSRPYDLESVRPHLKSIFSDVSDVKLEKTEDTLSSVGEKTPVPAFVDYRRPGAAPVPRGGATTPRASLNLPPGERFPVPMSSEAFKRSERSGSIHLSESNVDETSELWQAATAVSPEGELLELDEEVSLTDGVETWLQSLQQSIHRTIAKSISRIVRDIGLGVAMEEWAFRYPSQVARLGLLYYWTKECELAVSELKYERKAIPNASKKFSTVINRLPTCLTRGAWKGLDEPFLPIHKLRLQNMITYSLYLRDTLEGLGNRKLRDVTDFEWRRNIRFYMHESGEGSGNHQLCILDGRYEYGCEFLGGRLPLAMTALTERCFLTMSQALTQLKGSAVVGGTGVGKTETVKGMAYLLGRYMAVFACMPQMDTAALGKIIQGLAADGSWGLFDNFHNLNRSGVGVLLEHAQSIYTALRAKKHTCHLADGQEVPVDPYVATFITINKDMSRGFELPQEIRALYRNVSLVLPDLGLILRGKVAGLGFKSPKVLADRLRLMADLCRDQLPKEHHHHFSLAALTGVISHAYQKKKIVKEEKQAAMETMSQVSRSNSVISLAIGSQAGFSQTTSTTPKTTRSKSCSYAGPGGPPTFQKVAGTVQHVRAAVKRHSCDISPKPKVPIIVPQKESEPVSFQKLGKTVQQMTVLSSPSWEISPSPSINVKIGERTRKAGNPNMLTPAAKVEHSMVSDALQECIAPRLKGEDLVTFTGILKDTFANLPDANQLTQQFSLGVEPAMVHTAQEKGLIPHVPWINKCMSLYKLSQVHKGIIVAGPPASGKSSCIATLVEALSSISAPTPSTRGRGKPALGTSHKLLRLNPLVVDDYGLVFGHLNQNHDWVDGIFTHAWRKACRNKSTTWLCLDGPLNPGWADNFSSVLDNENTFHLPNGDRLPLSDNVRLLFETTDLQFASPATISRAGIVYMDKNVLGWRPIAQAWLESRPHHEVINLQRAFNKTLDAVSNFVINEAKAVSLSGSFVRRTKVPVCEVGMFQNCLNLLKAMLDDNVEIGGELHVERLFLFCLIWTFGGLLQGTDRQAFSNLLTSLTSALPDYDHEISVFDYYVDESGEWDPWTSRVQEDTYPDNANISGEVFVETVDTIRCQVLMDYALSSGQNVLLVGPPGSGKTSLINDLIDTQDPATHIVKRLVWSSASEASQLQEFVEANIHHRQGFVYGAKDYKGFQIFIDDINMPARDEFGVQRVNENLRELLDHHILLKLQKPFEWRTVEGLSVLATLTLHEYPSTSTQLLSERLIRHFSVVHLPAQQGQDLESVVNSMLEANMSFDGQGLDTELHNSLTAASCELLTTVQDVLRPSPMPGRQHYMFTLRNIAKAFQCMKRLTSESRADEKMVVGLWRHEVWHIMENSICRRSDQNWFNHNLQEILKKHFPTIEIETLPPHFVTFPIDGRAYQRPVTTMSTDKKIRVALQAITSMKEVQETLASHLASYNERFRNEQLDVLLCEYVFQHIARVHRVLSFQNGGNLLMIGAIGSHLVTMVKLALHIADMDMYHVDCSRANTFFDGLRSAVRMTGSEGKMLTLLFTAKDLHDESYLDAINSLLVCGEYPPLFSNDELEGLLQVLGPAMKKAYAHLMSNPMKFFVSRVKSNLKIVICLPPRHRLLRVAASQYPGLLTSCQVNWVCAWTQECLLDKANYFVEKYNMVSDNQEMRDKLVTVMANIHSYVLQDCRQIPWAGNMEETVSLTMCKRDSKKDQYKTQMLELPNLPYSKSIMHERILLQHKGDSKVSHRSIPMGPTIYRRFMECFLHILSTKTAQQNANITRLKKALSTLSQTREDAKLMEEKIKVVQADYEEAQKKTAGLLRQLTGKATTLEKLKAQLGGEGSLGAYLQLNEVSSEEEEEDDLLKQDDIGEDSDAIEVLMASYIRSTRVMEEYSTIKHRQYRSHWKSHDRDEYDDEFDRMRKENMKSRKLQVVEELAAAKKAVEDAKKALEGSRKKVLQWRESVSRQCVERIRAFQNPPVLVALVMDMMMTLLGRRKIPKQDTGEEKEGKNSQTDRTSSASSLSFKPLVKRESKRQESSRHGSTGTKEGDKVDRNEWKKLQHAMSDSVKFVEMVHRVPWQDGLHPDILAAVQGYLASSKNGDAGPTGEGSLLEAGMSASTLVSPRRSGGSSPPGLTIAGVRYSSEDAAVLLQYTIAIVEYTQLCGPLQIAKERLQNLQDEIEESERLEKEQEVELEAWTGKLRLRVRKITERVQEPEEPQISLLDHVEEEEEELGPNDLPIIQGEVDRLQEEFDEAVMEKHRLENELHNCHERLRAATETIKSLREQELLWQQSVEENSSNDLLLSNCITAAAFLTYCGPMGLDGRNSMYEFFLHVCEHYGLPIPNKMLYRDVPLVNFLYTDVQIKHLELQGLPTNPVALDSSCFVTETLSNNSWVLLCDPTSRAIPWLTDYLKEGFIIAKYHDLKSQLETCLTEGLFLILTDIDLHVLAKDNRFNHVFRRRMSFLTGKAPFKIIVGSHEVECRPGFRLYMHTTCMPHEVPEEVAAYTSMVNFYQDRSGIEAELLDRFIRLEKTRVQDERTNLAQEKISNMERLALLEDQMLNLLASDTRLLNNLAVTKKLADMKKQFDETQYSQQKIEVSEAAIRRNCEQFRTIATRAAVLFDASRHMREINSCYQISFDQFLAVFDAAIKHSERASTDTVVDRLTYSAYMTTARSLFERDKMLFALLVSMELEDSEGRLGPGEREFIISPTFASTVMSTMGYGVGSDARANARKPFDWMLDDQYHNLQVLAVYYQWFQDAFDKLPKDGRELPWRTVCENDKPELAALPDKMDDYYTPMQRYCVIRALRSDRIMHASSNFVSKVLGKKYAGEIPLDLPSVLRQSTPQTPIILLYTSESDLAETLFVEFAAKKQESCQVVYLSSGSPQEERRVRRAMAKAAEEGHWLLLHNAHNALHFLQSLDTALQEKKLPADSNFRLWVSAQPHPKLCIHLLQHAIKVVVDTPMMMRDHMVRSMQWIEPETLKTSTRPEWPAVLHNLFMVHGALRLRARFGRGGWNRPEDMVFGNNELQEGLRLVLDEFSDTTSTDMPGTPGKGIAWTALRYMLTEVIYGSYVSDEYDQLTLSAMVDYWMGPNAMKKEFEVPRLKHKIPAAFFANYIRYNSLVQALEQIPNFFLDVPEACNMHSFTETLLGDDQYIFTRLNSVYDIMPSSPTLSHVISPRPPTPYGGPPLTSISATSSLPLVVNRGVFATQTYAALKNRKEQELYELSTTLLTKVPRAWGKEYIADRIKKLGGATAFNVFIQREVEALMKLIGEVRRSLNAIKAAADTVEALPLGDQLSEEYLTVADDLYHYRTPELWCRLGGDAVPPPTWNPAQWLTDLTNRHAHFEKLLSQGREKFPAYWPGAFFQPRALFGLLKSESVKNFTDKYGFVEPLMFQTEITTRDKDHLRDPPTEGMFVFGMYLWGCTWEKTTSELLDTPPKSGPSALPVIHITCVPQSDKLTDPVKAAETYQCPCYISRTNCKEPVLTLDVRHDGITATRWSLRGLAGTLRPF
ncbi:uncharacterized protein [Branchiostoma lanceolatum]|uniref:uncharacterized protein n=1 Tax=Branchiostoma lanceolatum TaxID=7740 RepID=UPI003451C846